MDILRPDTVWADKGEASAADVRKLRLDLTDEENELFDRILAFELDETRNTPREVRREQITRALSRPALDQDVEVSES